MNEKEALEAVRIMKPKLVIPCHYNLPALFNKNFNPADDTMFKREVEKMGIECSIMKYGDSISI
jgi:L-ascorbate metabolism protein UlaG (beta-lactamase superfamily)